MIVSEDRLSRAVKYLSGTDEECARLAGLYKGLEDQLKTIYGLAFQETAGPQETRKAEAYTKQIYRDHINKIIVARNDYELIRIKRSTEERIISVWQSENANRRAGVIL